MVLAEDAQANGQVASSTPTDDNPFHADIILPNHVIGDPVALKLHAIELALASLYFPPESTVFDPLPRNEA